MIDDQFINQGKVHSVYLSAGFENGEDSVHDHDCFELLFLESGTREVTLSGKKYRLSPGELLFIFPGELHHFSKKDRTNGKFYIVRFYPQALSASTSYKKLSDDLEVLSSSEIRHIKLTEQDSADIFRSFAAILRTVKEGTPIKELFLRAYTLNLLAWIMEKCHQKSEDKHIFLENITSEKVFDVIQYINHHYTENIKLSALSKKFYISYSHLSRQFKKITGKNFNDYVNELRLKKALFLLASTSLSIAEISKSLGFCKHSHFTELFLARYKTTPLKLRRSFQSVLL